jgi:hypothetical protein
MDAITASSSAASLAQTQMAASMKILKLSQTAAAEPTAALLDAAMENVQASIEAMAGATLDTTA